MASSLYAAAAESRRPAKTVTGAGQLTINDGEYTVAAALVINDIVFIAKLPARHVIVDFLLDVTDLDTNGTPLASIDVGVYSLAEVVEDVDALIDGSTIARTGGVARMGVPEGRRLAPSDVDRLIGVKFVAAPATSAVAGTIQGTLFSRVAGVDD